MEIEGADPWIVFRVESPATPCMQRQRQGLLHVPCCDFLHPVSRASIYLSVNQLIVVTCCPEDDFGAQLNE